MVSLQQFVCEHWLTCWVFDHHLELTCERLLSGQIWLNFSAHHKPWFDLLQDEHLSRTNNHLIINHSMIEMSCVSYVVRPVPPWYMLDKSLPSQFVHEVLPWYRLLLCISTTLFPAPTLCVVTSAFPQRTAVPNVKRTTL